MAAYDIVIIGGGPGGYNAAIRAGQLGLRAACVEKRATLGGACLNVGCIPSKALLHSSELFEMAAKDFAGFGIITEPRLDLPAMMKQKAEAVAALTKGVEFLFRKNKVDWIKGTARLLGGGKVSVAGAAGETTLEARAIVIATGSEPAPLASVPLDGRRILDSTGALALSEVPRRLAVIGAGIIGLELGSVWRRLGAEVTVLEFLDRITPGVDLETAKVLQRSLTRQGVAFRLGVRVTGAKAAADTVTLSFEPVGGGAAESLEAEVVLVAVGRKPYAEGLGLEAAGVAVDPRGFILTEAFRTTADGVFAIGDATHGPMLAHKAEDEAVACVEIIAGRAGHVDYEVIPSVIYTYPEVAVVGRTEEELKAVGVAYKAGKFPFTANARARVNGETDGFVKVLADAQSDRILGVHMIGPDVSEMIGEACVAMSFGGASEDVARTCHPHPTRSEALRQAAMAVEGWAMQA
ncbi:MAG TPA: dihydrolipoyl dehydrogenase [Caulobacteraceae bacterium]|nr:dihydrolipoyl dehydrogenase [Caulobacteraceae bacterium]